MRRTIVVVLAGGLAAATVVAVRAVVGGGTDSGAQPPAATEVPDATETGAATAGVDGSGETAGGVVTAGSVEVDEQATQPSVSAPPSIDNPATVYIVGDSDAGTFGPYLKQLLDGTKIVTTELNYKVSSGLARPDFFDWPAELARTLDEVGPDIVVATFGGNDSQGLAVADGSFIVGDPVANEAEWTAEYRRRVGEVMDLALADGRTLVWVGIPNDDNADVTARLRVQNEAVKAEAAARPGVVFVDTWSRFSGRSGGWAEYVIDPRDGQGKDVRASDGFHLNENGAEILALDIAQAIRDDLRARGAAI